MPPIPLTGTIMGDMGSRVPQQAPGSITELECSNGVSYRTLSYFGGESYCEQSHD